MLDYDLFPKGEYQISPGHMLRKDVVRQLGFAGILISLGLILLIGPLTETLAHRRLRHFVYNASIATLGGSAALYMRISWEFTQR